MESKGIHFVSRIRLVYMIQEETERARERERTICLQREERNIIGVEKEGPGSKFPQIPANA